MNAVKYSRAQNISVKSARFSILKNRKFKRTNYNPSYSPIAPARLHAFRVCGLRESHANHFTKHICKHNNNNIMFSLRARSGNLTRLWGGGTAGKTFPLSAGGDDVGTVPRTQTGRMNDKNMQRREQDKPPMRQPATATPFPVLSRSTSSSLMPIVCVHVHDENIRVIITIIIKDFLLIAFYPTYGFGNHLSAQDAVLKT